MHHYRVVVAGRLGAAGRTAFAELDPQLAADRTILSGQLDQAQLFSTLMRIQNLGIELIEVTRSTPSDHMAGRT